MSLDKPYRILLVDDQDIMLEGIRLMINKQEDMEVVGTAPNGKIACDKAVALKPDLILMDIRMPGMDGIEATRWIKEHHPGIIVLLLTTFNEEEYIIEGLAQRADGYLLKSMDYQHLITTVREAAKGNFMLPPEVAVKLAQRIRREGGAAGGADMQQLRRELKKQHIELTEREEEIVQLLLTRLSNKEIGARLFISEGTVKNYVSDIYSKLGVHKRVEAIELLGELLRRA